MKEQQLATSSGDYIARRQKSAQQIFDEYYAEEHYSVSTTNPISEHERLTISLICRRPELRPLLKQVEFVIGDTGSVPFVVSDDRTVTLSRNILRDPLASILQFFRLLEILVLKRRLKETDSLIGQIAVAIAAFHTTLQYFDDLIEVEQTGAWRTLDTWEQETIIEFRNVTKSGSEHPAIFHLIAAKLDHLLPLQGQHPVVATDASPRDVAVAVQRVTRLHNLLYPTARLLTMGGDNRLALDNHTGLNAYGCSPRPRPWAITFSSCTASSISELAFQHAEWQRQDLLEFADEDKLLDHGRFEYEQIRKEIKELMGLDGIQGTEVVLASSGTDAELHALYFALCHSSMPIRNIVISSTEIGSGTVFAAGGKHFDTDTPLGSTVIKGEPVAGFPCEQVEVSVVELRNEDGNLLSLEELGAATTRLVEESIACGQRVLIHLLDCSKTGIGGPTFTVAKQLRRSNPELVDVVVDAAQTRITNYSLHQFLQEEFMIIMSASKFFTGPPFAGALIVPPKVAARIATAEALPSGLKDYSAKYEFPLEWSLLTASLEPILNFGLLMRWRAALWEMKAFYEVDLTTKMATISKFGDEIIHMIDQNPDLDLIMAPPPPREHPSGSVQWDQLPSIFTFTVNREVDGKHVPLTYDNARIAYRIINMDASYLLPIQASDREYELMRKRCHIGQPVRIPTPGCEWIGALRIAAGARLVSGVQFDDALGRTPNERLAMEIRTAGVIFSKISVILKYWEHLAAHDLSEASNFVSNRYHF